jgi:hypothetical protein
MKNINNQNNTELKLLRVFFSTWDQDILHFYIQDKHIHQKTGSKEQTKHPPKDRVKSTDNTSTKRKGQKNKQTTHPP